MFHRIVDNPYPDRGIAKSPDKQGKWILRLVWNNPITRKIEAQDNVPFLSEMEARTYLREIVLKNPIIDFSYGVDTALIISPDGEIKPC